MNRHRSRFLRRAVTSAREWERGILIRGQVSAPFPFELARTDLGRALLHRVLIRSWDRLARHGVIPMSIAMKDLDGVYRRTGAGQSVQSIPVFEYLLSSFRVQLAAEKYRAALSDGQLS